MIPVKVHGGLVVMHTREEFERLWGRVDRVACKEMNKDLEGGEECLPEGSC